MNVKAIRTINDMKNSNWDLVDGWWRSCDECGSFNVQFLETDKEHGHQLKYVCMDCGFKSQAIKRNPDGKSDRVHQSEWSKLVLDRAGGKCEICGCDKAAVEAHHKVSYQVARRMKLSDYDIWAPYNGIALCKEHHREWHKQSLLVETAYESRRNKHK